MSIIRRRCPRTNPPKHWQRISVGDCAGLIKLVSALNRVTSCLKDWWIFVANFLPVNFWDRGWYWLCERCTISVKGSVPLLLQSRKNVQFTWYRWLLYSPNGRIWCPLPQCVYALWMPHPRHLLHCAFRHPMPTGRSYAYVHSLCLQGRHTIPSSEGHDNIPYITP